MTLLWSANLISLAEPHVLVKCQFKNSVLIAAYRFETSMMPLISAWTVYTVHIVYWLGLVAVLSWLATSLDSKEQGEPRIRVHVCQKLLSNNIWCCISPWRRPGSARLTICKETFIYFNWRAENHSGVILFRSLSLNWPKQGINIFRAHPTFNEDNCPHSFRGYTTRLALNTSNVASKSLTIEET